MSIEIVHIFLNNRLKTRHQLALKRFDTVYYYYKLFYFWFIIRREKNKKLSFNLTNSILKYIKNLEPNDRNIALLYSSNNTFIIGQYSVIKAYFKDISIFCFSDRFFIPGLHDFIIHNKDHCNRFYLNTTQFGFLVIKED